MPSRKHVHEPEPGVVPRELVFRSRIAETGNDAQW
jgi:hypothetical protein